MGSKQKRRNKVKHGMTQQPHPQPQQQKKKDNWMDGLPLTGGTGGGMKRCFHDHPDYEIAPGLTIYGGSCITPAHLDADMYVGLDHGMRRTSAQWPWTPGEEIFFPITDMNVPENLEQFNKLLDHMEAALKAGKKVHVGCIGGHGRTGLVFAALRRKLVPGDPDAIQHVRANYCKKTVESEKQVAWLMEHFGASTAEATKKAYAYSPPQTAPSSGHSKPWSGASSSYSPPVGGSGRKRTTGAPSNKLASIWG